MDSRSRSGISLLTAAALLCASLTPILHPDAARAADAPATLSPAACQVADEGAFRTQIEALTFAAIVKGLDKLDYSAMVNAAWRTTGADSVLDQRVAKSIAEIQEETSWATLLQSLASREAAQTLATSVAERTYRSEEMKQAVEAVAVDVGKQLSGRIELATLDAAQPAVACVRAFLGPRYGSTIALMVGGDTGKAFEQTASAGSAEVTSGDLAIQSKGLIAGAVLLVVRRSLANLAKRIGQRVVGAVLGRIVSVVAGGVGLVLIAKDIWEMRNGILPIIESEMKSEDTKTKVRQEIATAIGEQLQTHLKEVSAATADRILDVWQQFKQAHAKVVELSARLPAFKAFIDTVSPEGLPRADRAVTLVLAAEGEGGISKRLEDGTLDTLSKKAPEQVLDIAADTKSVEAALGWQRLAGALLGSVADLELHKVAKPEDFTADGLKKLLALDDRFAALRIAALPRTMRDAVAGLTPERQKSLARALSPDELSAFAGYVQGLKQNAAVRLISAVADDPQRMKLLSNTGLQQAILSSRDQNAAVGVILRDGALFDLLSLQQDFGLVTGGDISPFLLWHKHTGAVTTALGAGALLLLMLARLLFGRRRVA
jgi:hypothetical protein